MTTAPVSLTLAHLNLDVADLERSNRFYRDVLGFDVTRRFDSLLIRWPGGLLVLVEGSVSALGSFHFGFRVDGTGAVDDWFVRLKSRDAQIVEMPIERGSVYVGRFRDPDGYPIEIYAELSKSSLEAPAET